MAPVWDQRKLLTGSDVELGLKGMNRHLLDVRSTGGEDAAARDKRRLGVLSRVPEAGDVALWSWVWPRRIRRWQQEVEEAQWG